VVVALIKRNIFVVEWLVFPICIWEVCELQHYPRELCRHNYL